VKFIDEHRHDLVQGVVGREFGVEPICRVLSEHGCQIAPGTYVAFCIDVYSRLITGWRCSSSMNTSLPLDALEMGIWQRQRTGRSIQGLVHHSIAGSQYTSIRYTNGSPRPVRSPRSARWATPTTVRMSGAGRQPDSCLRLTPWFGCLGC
jgi:transposase InsO family protein